MIILKTILTLILLFIWPASQAAGQVPVVKISEFENAIAISANAALGEVYILDDEHANIFKYDKAFKRVGSAGGYGIEKEAFDTPTDVSASDGINIYVTDRGNQRITQFDRRLNFISALPELPISNTESSSESASSFQLSGDIWRPISLSVSMQGELFILEETSRQIIKINPFNFPKTASERKSLLRFGGFNAGRGSLIEPHQVAASKSGMVFISDKGRSSVVVYDQFGNFITTIGDEKLDQLNGIATAELLPNEGAGKHRKELFLVANGKEVLIFDAAAAKGFPLVKAIDAEKLLGEEIPFVTDVALVHGNLCVLTPKSLFVVSYQLAL